MRLTMRFIMSISIATLMVCAALCAEVYADPPKDVPEAAIEEVNRLDHDVQELGTIQAGPETGVRRAMAPPLDDSDKWFVNFIGAGSHSSDKEKAATKLLLDDVKTLKFKAYVKPDVADSWSHWQEYREDDPLQQDWLAPIRPKLKAVGLPAIVIQPPSSGKYGPNKTVVCVVGGYDGDARKLQELIRVRVEAYIHKHGYDGTLAMAQITPKGHAQTVDEPIGAKSPFDLPEPIAYPDAKDLPRAPLTYEEIRKLAPDLNPAIAKMFANQKMTEEQFLDAYDEYQHAVDTQANRDIDGHLADDGDSNDDGGVNKKPANPTQGGSAFGEILIVGILGIMVMGGVWFVQQRKSGKNEQQGIGYQNTANQSARQPQTAANGPYATAREYSISETNLPSNATVANSTRNTPSHPGPSPGSLGVYSEDQAGS
jgi:hypothetical protein